MHVFNRKISSRGRIGAGLANIVGVASILAATGAMAIDPQAWEGIRRDAVAVAEKQMKPPLRPELLRGKNIERDGAALTDNAIQQWSTMINVYSQRQLGKDALRYLGDKAFPQLVKALDSPWLRFDAIQLLADLGEPGRELVRDQIKKGNVDAKTLPRFIAPQLILDASTYKGESFSSAQYEEILRMAINNPSSLTQIAALRALDHLGASDEIAKLLPAIPQLKSPSSAFGLLDMRMPPFASWVVNIMRDEKTNDQPKPFPDVKYASAWVVPILVGLLDDPTWSMHQPWEAQVNVPRNELAHWMYTHGHSGVLAPLQRNQPVTLDEKAEIASIKDWWNKHRQDFIEGRYIDVPTTHYVFHDFDSE